MCSSIPQGQQLILFYAKKIFLISLKNHLEKEYNSLISGDENMYTQNIKILYRKCPVVI